MGERVEFGTELVVPIQGLDMEDEKIERWLTEVRALITEMRMLKEAKRMGGGKNDRWSNFFFELQRLYLCELKVKEEI